MNFYLDFDYTLFNTYEFRNELYKILESNNCNRDALKLTIEEGNHKLINIREKFKELSKRKNIPIENFIKPLEELYNNCEKYIYDDSIEFLKYLKQQNHKLYILTWGEKEYQKEKVKASKLEKYVDEVIYTEKLKYNLEIQYKEGIFIDDSVRDLKGLHAKKAKNVFRIKRVNGKNSHKELNIEEIKEFTSLKELKEYLIRIGIN
ncbi:MAG: HAD family hydrolase [Clostridia bacterium]|nr:HAD family hydrolase [Clostridia bacterium]